MYFIKLIIIFRGVNYYFRFKIMKQKISLQALWPSRFCSAVKTGLFFKNKTPFFSHLSYLWTSIHKVCIRDKQEKAAQLPFALG